MSGSLPTSTLEEELRREASLSSEMVLAQMAARGRRSALAIHAVRLSLSGTAGRWEPVEILIGPLVLPCTDRRHGIAANEAATTDGR